MNKIIIIDKSAVKKIPASQLEPLQICRIEGGPYKGEIAMRTASEAGYELMKLSNPGINKCWLADIDILVTPLPNATIEVHLNE